MTDCSFESHAEEVLSELERKKNLALEAICMKAEGYAKDNIKNGDRIDTGRLRNSITYVIRDNNGFIGTNVEYAPYIEYGTGIFATKGNGRKEPWIYKDAKGHFHYTRGIPPIHFLKKAAEDHVDEYKKLAKQVLQNE